MVTRDSISFDRAVDYYDSTRGYPQEVAGQAAALLAQVGRLGPESRVIEIGIGTGRIALPLAPHAGRYYGIDLSRAMMEQLRAKQQDEHIWIAQADATRLPLPADHFDLAMAVHVFHLIPNWRQGMAELARVLKPGGLFINLRDRHLDDAFRSLWRLWAQALGKSEGVNVGVQHDQYDSFPLDAGWIEVGEPQTLRYERPVRPSTFLDWMRRRYFSSTWRMSDGELAQVIDILSAHIEAHFPSPDEPVAQANEIILQAYRPPA